MSTRQVGIVGFVLVALVGALWATWHFAFYAPIPIGGVLRDPTSYGDRDITIAGTVTSRFSIMGWKCFTLLDDTGEIRVLTKRVLPRIGQRKRVTGRVDQLITFTIPLFGEQNVIVLIEDSDP